MTGPNEPLSPKVIIVEDDDELRHALTFAFETEGFGVQSFASAEDLLDERLLSQNGCLVVDYWLPRMNGLALLSRLRERGHNLPAVLITTTTREIERSAALASIAIVDKPLLSNALIGKVRDLLLSRAAE